MRLVPLLALSALLLVGCAPKEEPAAATPAPDATAAAPQNAGGVAPIGSGAAGGLTPVQGAENVGGAGMGGMGGVAKDMARGAAAKAGGAGSMGGAGAEGGE